MLSFQEIITSLLGFWADQGCVVQQGYDLEVGAGTFNPATFLRCLGPEPFNTVYVEPSRRPQDGRFGDNPNRVQLFHQLQVIMKPSPSDIQDRYIQSLEILGFQLKNHDIRFVHDDWESPTLGAWGLGWEVWLDGMEITQFTYFQSMAGHALNPISVELTYGLERICMASQKKGHFFEMKWNERLTYGDLFRESEAEWSDYNFHLGSTPMWKRHFDDFEKEALFLIERKLPFPAYDFVIKASHAFNLLEARGSFSVTERVGYIMRIRALSKRVAAEFLKSRERLNFPLMRLGLEPEKGKGKGQTEPFSQKIPPSLDKEDFLLEIGSEELPPTFIPIGLSSLKGGLEKLFKEQNLVCEKIEMFGAPRRLAALVKNLSSTAKREDKMQKGPPLSLAFDDRGEMTKQGAGFFRSIGIRDAPACLDLLKESKRLDLKIEQIEGKDYLFFQIEKEARFTSDILKEKLPEVIKRLHFPKKMRWTSPDVTYARPLRWIVALLGKRPLSFNVATVCSGNISYGHRQTNPEPFEISKPWTYETLLESHAVLANIAKRRASILSQLEAIESKTQKKALEKEKVIKQVLFLSEHPHLLCASFDPKFLRVPKEVLIAEMVEHQRYFPLANRSQELSNLFVITSDNLPTREIKVGNEHVLKARLSDAVFLYEKDLEEGLDSFGEKLKSITFQEDLGSLGDKTDRIKLMALSLAKRLKMGERKKLERGATLSKADLATGLVQEFPHLQGVIGKEYALHQKEEFEVAQSIEEHWMPTSEKGSLPKSKTGTLISLADKLDNLVSYFSVGLKPTSSGDPYALRRQTIGCIKILIENRLSLNLKEFLFETCSTFSSHQSKEALVDELLGYITGRFKSVLEEYHFKKDEVEASLEGVCVDPYDQFLKTEALHLFRKKPAFNSLYEIYKRAKGQLEDQKPLVLRPDRLKEKSELFLYQTLEKITPPFEANMKQKEYEAAFNLLITLQKPLDTLFDQVKILSDEPDLRENRLALLQRIFGYFAHLMDFSQIQVS